MTQLNLMPHRALCSSKHLSALHTSAFDSWKRKSTSIQFLTIINSRSRQIGRITVRLCARNTLRSMKFRVIRARNGHRARPSSIWRNFGDRFSTLFSFFLLATTDYHPECRINTLMIADLIYILLQSIDAYTVAIEFMRCTYLLLTLHT